MPFHHVIRNFYSQDVKRQCVTASCFKFFLSALRLRRVEEVPVSVMPGIPRFFQSPGGVVCVRFWCWQSVEPACCCSVRRNPRKPNVSLRDTGTVADTPITLRPTSEEGSTAAFTTAALTTTAFMGTRITVVDRAFSSRSAAGVVTLRSASFAADITTTVGTVGTVAADDTDNTGFTSEAEPRCMSSLCTAENRTAEFPRMEIRLFVLHRKDIVLNRSGVENSSARRLRIVSAYSSRRNFPAARGVNE